MSAALLALVLLVDLVVAVWCHQADGQYVAAPSQGVILLPFVLYAGWLALVSRAARLRAPAALLALLAVPLHLVAGDVVEALAERGHVPATSPLLQVEPLLVSPVLVAAWGVARLDGPWRRGLVVAPAVVVLQMVLARASAADQVTSDVGLLSWLWGLLPVAAGVVACELAAGRWSPEQPPGTTTARHPRG